MNTSPLSNPLSRTAAPTAASLPYSLALSGKQGIKQLVKPESMFRFNGLGRIIVVENKIHVEDIGIKGESLKRTNEVHVEDIGLKEFKAYQ